MNQKRAFTLIELLVVIAIIALLIGLLLPALAKAQRNAKTLKDSTQIKEIHKAMLIFSNDHKGRLPVPGLIRRLEDPYTGEFIPGVGPEDFNQNDTARLYSVMIAQEFFNTDLLIGPTEVNELVVEMQDYNFSAYEPGANTPTFWDDDFGSDLNDAAGQSEDCNTSYAHAALCGQRKKIKWRNTQIEGHPIISTRGTDGTNEPVGNGVGGDIRGTNYTQSPTLLLHGPKKQWVGNVVFSDNHTETIETFYPTLTSYEALDSDGPQKDNIFSAEFADYDNGNQEGSADAWQVISRKGGTTGENRVAQIYDDLLP